MKKNIMLIGVLTLGFSLCLNTYSLKLEKNEQSENQETTIKNDASIINIIKKISKISDITKENESVTTNQTDSVVKEEPKVQETIQQPVKNNQIIVKPSPKPEKIGTLGRLYLPTINYSVAVYYANVYNNEEYNAQTIVDNEDSAAYYQLGNKYIIADHYYQGFKKIINLSVGDEAHIKMNDGTIKKYHLENKLVGQNTSVDLTDEAGNSIQTMDGTLVMYTCYGSDKTIMITLWNEIL